MIRADDPTGSVVPTPQPSAATTVASGGPDDATHRSPPLAAALSPVEGAPGQIGPYRITEVIGRGGMGVVYAAVDTRLERRVAIKAIAGGTGGELTARFQREARSMARLGKHPHIVQVHEVDRAEGRDYLVMDLVLGPTLAELLRSGPLPVTRAAEIGEKVARALDHAHRHGLIHRDVKPSNVLMTPEGEPQVSDFGLVKDAQSEERLSATGAILGTPSYMAPEQAERPDAVDARADVYGTGALLYHAVTGRPPFEGGSWAATIALVLSDSPTPPAQVRPQISRDAQAVIEKAMEREPGARYQSAQLLADDLGRLARGEPVQARPRSWLRRALSGTRKRPLRAAIGMALLLVAAGAAALAPGWLAASRRERAERLREAASSRAGFSERAAALGEAIALDPTSWRSYADRARFRVEEIEERERTNEKFAARYDSTALAQEALADCDKALAIRPDAAPVLLERAELEERLGKDADAARDHEAYALADPAAASAYVARGRKRWERGDRKGAIAHLDRAAKLAPETVEPYLYRGPMLAETGKIDAAIADYDRAIVLAPKMAKLRYGRAHLVQFYKRDAKGALAGFSEAVELDPQDANNWFARGNLRRMVRPPDVDGAIADYRKALELSPTLNGPATNLGILLSARGKQAEARAAFTEAIRRDPGFGMNYYGRAMTWLEGKTQDPDEAKKDLDQACEREAKEPLPFWRRGALREDAGDLEGALADYEVARARIPEGNPQRANIEETIADVRGKLEAKGAKGGATPSAPTPTARGEKGDF